MPQNTLQGGKKLNFSSLEGIPIEAIIADSELLNKQMNKNNPWRNLSLRTWQEVVKTCHLNDSIKPLRWCAYDTNFIPNRMDGRFKLWAAKGLTNYFFVYEKGGIPPF